MADRLRVVAGRHDWAPQDLLEATDRHGLFRESTYVWSVFRTRTAEPDIYSAMRRFSAPGSWPTRLLLQSNSGAEGLRRFLTDLVAARSDDSSLALLVDLAPGSVRWSEGDLLDVTGSEVTPALRWHLPGDDGMFYASRIFRVAGHVVGQPVDGFVGVDEVYLASGRHNYVDDPITSGHLSDAWCTWATAYDDGSVEAGHVAFGRNGFGIGIRAADGVAYVAESVAGVVENDDRGVPRRIEFDVDGESWEFVADGRGLPIEPSPGPVRQAEGCFRRVGETRTPVVWCATPEVPARG